MSKSTIFALMLLLVSTTFLSEILAQPGAENLKADISSKSGDYTEIVKPSDLTAHQELQNTDLSNNSDLNEQSLYKNVPSLPSLSISDLRKAGFFDPYINQTSVINAIFGVLSEQEAEKANLLQYQVLEENHSIGIVQELDYLDSQLAAMAMQKLIQSGEAYPYFKVNKTNSYGDESAYFNHQEKAEQVFILIRKENKLYAFTYLKAFHPKFVELFQVLS